MAKEVRMKSINGFSINGKVCVGKHTFEVQTEAKEDSLVVSSVFFKGRVVKQYSSSIPSDEKREVYLRKFHEEVKRRFVSDLISQKKRQGLNGNGNLTATTFLKRLTEKIEKSVTGIRLIYLETNGNTVFNRLVTGFVPLLSDFVSLLNKVYGDLEVAVFPVKGKRLLFLKGKKLLSCFLIENHRELTTLNVSIIKPLKKLILEIERELS